MSYALKVKRIDLYLQFDRFVEESELVLMEEWVKLLSQGHPLEYIIGEIEFFGCRIQVDPRVLIPRQETEILVDLISRKLNALVVKQLQLCDLCTGSGCIGISLKKKFPELTVLLSDLSKEALAVARKNAQRNHVDVEMVQGDLLDSLVGKEMDVVVCNPPYVSTSEYFSLDASVRDFEPKMALIGGEQGIEFYERLEKGLPFLLRSGAQVFLEIGATQGGKVKKIFSQPHWNKRELICDWSGKERFFFLEKQ